LNAFKQSLRGLGVVRLATLGAVDIACLGFLVFVAQRLPEPPMVSLYGGFDPADSGKIVARLEQMSMPYRLVGDPLLAGGSPTRPMTLTSEAV